MPTLFLGCAACAMVAGAAAVFVSIALFGIRFWTRMRGKKTSCACCRKHNTCNCDKKAP